MPILNNSTLETARFRGVDFSVSQHSVKSGRRLAEHVFPGADYALQEDVGRLDRTYELTAHIMAQTIAGDQDLPDKYRQLVAALEMEGPAELIHPWLGPLWVVARPAQIEESLDKRRQIRLKLSFIEVPRETSLELDSSLEDLTSQFLSEVVAAVNLGLSALYIADHLPSFVRVLLGQAIGDIGGLFEAARHELRLPRVGAQILADTALDLHSNGEGLSAQPAGLTSRLVSGFGAMLGSTLPPPLFLRSLVKLFAQAGVRAPPVPAQTLARQRQTANYLALGGAVRLFAVTVCLVQALRGTFSDREIGFTVRDELVRWLDREQRLASARMDESGFTHLRRLERSGLPILTRQVRALAGRRETVLARSEPALVTAYRELADARRDQAFAALNGVLHPGLMPAGVVLAVPAA